MIRPRFKLKKYSLVLFLPFRALRSYMICSYKKNVCLFYFSMEEESPSFMKCAIELDRP